MENNTQKKTSITPLFYRGVPAITGDENNVVIPFNIEDYANLCEELVYVIDFLKRGFQYVVNREFFFCGYSVEEVMSLGYDFYPIVIHPDDMAPFADMHATILKRAFTMKTPDEINYFSFNLRIKTVIGYLMAYHKMKLIFVDGHVRFGICMMTNSVSDQSGNLRAYYPGDMVFEEYSTDRGWQKAETQPLTMQEKKYLFLQDRDIPTR